MPGYQPLTPEGNQNIVNQQANNNALITALRRRQSLPAGYAPRPMLQAPQPAWQGNMANFTDMMNRYNYGRAQQAYGANPTYQLLARLSPKIAARTAMPTFEQWMANGQQLPSTNIFGGGFGNVGDAGGGS